MSGTCPNFALLLLTVQGHRDPIQKEKTAMNLTVKVVHFVVTFYCCMSPHWEHLSLTWVICQPRHLNTFNMNVPNATFEAILLCYIISSVNYQLLNDFEKHIHHLYLFLCIKYLRELHTPNENKSLNCCVLTPWKIHNPLIHEYKARSPPWRIWAQTQAVQ